MVWRVPGCPSFLWSKGTPLYVHAAILHPFSHPRVTVWPVSAFGCCEWCFCEHVCTHTSLFKDLFAVLLRMFFVMETFSVLAPKFKHELKFGWQMLVKRSVKRNITHDRLLNFSFLMQNPLVTPLPPKSNTKNRKAEMLWARCMRRLGALGSQPPSHTTAPLRHS